MKFLISQTKAFGMGYLLLCLCFSPDARGAFPPWAHRIAPEPVKECWRQLRYLRHHASSDAQRVLGIEGAVLDWQISRLQKIPVREIQDDRLVQSFLKEHPVYISLTTSPTRIAYVKYVLRTLNSALIKGVILAIPSRFGRDGSKYVIPEELISDPRLVILRPDTDIGPATKMVPAVEYLQQTDPKALLITVDDDQGYPPGMVIELATASAYANANHPDGAIVTGSGNNFSSWGIPVPAPNVLPFGVPLPETLALFPVNVVQGFSGIAYLVERIATNAIRRRAVLSPATLASDDLVISYSLALQGWALYSLKSNNPFHCAGLRKHFAYGSGRDALYRGAGLLTRPAHGSINAIKYRAAYEEMEMDRIRPSHVQKQIPATVGNDSGNG